MPIKKKNEISDKKDITLCPYCANEIKVWAKKCKYCKESLVEEKEFNKENHEIEQTNSKTKRIWWRILALSIPIVAILWIIIALIFYIIGVSTGGGSELIFTIKNTINWILWILWLLSIFFTIRWIVILAKSNSKSNGYLQDGGEIDTENVKSSMKLADVTKWFMYGYIIRVCIDCLVVFSWWDISEWIQIFLNFVFIIGALVSQIVRWFKTYRWMQKAQIGWLTFPTWRWRLVFWWICPIACWFMPYQIVRDIMNTYKLKTWKNINWSIVWRWWAVYLIGGFVSYGMLRQAWDIDISVLIFSYILDILEYVLFIVILTKIQKMQKEYIGLE